MSKQQTKRSEVLVNQVEPLLLQPDYLLEGSVERQCYMLGKLEDIDINKKLTSRNHILTTLDKKRNAGKLPWKVGQKESIVLSLSAYGIKIMQDDQNYILIDRIALHEIASVSYINDDQEHILCIKVGRKDANNEHSLKCEVFVFTCNKQSEAEYICSIIDQALELIYSEAAIQHFQKMIDYTEPVSMKNMSTLNDRNSPISVVPLKQTSESFSLSGNINTLPQLPIEDTNNIEILEKVNLHESPPTAESLVTSYMDLLHSQFNLKELKEFAGYLKIYRKGQSVSTFCENLLNLYGKERYFLLPGMKPFILERDVKNFEKFIVDHQILPVQQQNSIPPASPLPPDVLQALPPLNDTSPPLSQSSDISSPLLLPSDVSPIPPLPSDVPPAPPLPPNVPSLPSLPPNVLRAPLLPPDVPPAPPLPPDVPPAPPLPPDVPPAPPLPPDVPPPPPLPPDVPPAPPLPPDVPPAPPLPPDVPPAPPLPPDVPPAPPLPADVPPAPPLPPNVPTHLDVPPPPPPPLPPDVPPAPPLPLDVPPAPPLPPGVPPDPPLPPDIPPASPLLSDIPPTPPQPSDVLLDFTDLQDLPQISCSSTTEKEKVEKLFEDIDNTMNELLTSTEVFIY